MNSLDMRAGLNQVASHTCSKQQWHGFCTLRCGNCIFLLVSGTLRMTTCRLTLLFLLQKKVVDAGVIVLLSLFFCRKID